MSSLWYCRTLSAPGSPVLAPPPTPHTHWRVPAIPPPTRSASPPQSPLPPLSISYSRILLPPPCRIQHVPSMPHVTHVIRVGVMLTPTCFQERGKLAEAEVPSSLNPSNDVFCAGWQGAAASGGRGVWCRNGASYVVCGACGAWCSGTGMTGGTK